MANNATLQDPSRLTGTLVRQNGGIYQPVTPAGQKSVGANPDQAKMAGTPAQTKPIVQDAAAPAPKPVMSQPRDLSTQQQQSADQTKQQSQTFQALTGFNSRVQKLVESKLSTIGTGPIPATVAPTPVSAAIETAFQNNGVIPGTNQTVQQLLQQYAANPSDQTPLTVLSQALKTPNTAVTPQDIASWYDTSGKALGKQAAASLADDVLVADFNDADFAELGINGGKQQVATVLGMSLADLDAQTVSELQDQIKARIDQTQNQVQLLRAELARVPPNSSYAQQLQQKIIDLTGAGVATAEQRAREAVTKINDIDEVEIAGQRYTVKEFLADESISNLIANYVAATPDAKAKLIPNRPEFAGLIGWITQNEEGLRLAAERMKATATKFKSAQDQLVEFSASLPESVKANLPKVGQLTSDQVAAEMARVKDLPEVRAYTQVTSNKVRLGELGLTGPDLMTLQGIITANPDRTKDWTPEQLAESFKYGQLIQQRPEFQTVTGLKLTDQLPDEATRRMMDKVAPIADKWRDQKPETKAQLQASPKTMELMRTGRLTFDMLNAAGGVRSNDGKEVLASPEVLELIERGEINNGNAYQTLPAAAQTLGKFRQVEDMERKVLAAKDTDDLLQIMFQDSTLSVRKLQASYDNLQQRKALGDPTVEADFNRMAQLDVRDPKGVIDERDVEWWSRGFRSNNFPDWIANPDKKAPPLWQIPTTERNLMRSPSQRGSGIYGLVQNLLHEGLNRGEQEKIANSGNLDQLAEPWRKANLPPEMHSQADWNRHLLELEAQKKPKAMEEIKKETDNLLDPGEGTGWVPGGGGSGGGSGGGGPSLVEDLDGDGLISSWEDKREKPRGITTDKFNKAKDAALERLAKTDWSFKRRPM